jgi:hypothetical protein
MINQSKKTNNKEKNKEKHPKIIISIMNSLNQLKLNRIQESLIQQLKVSLRRKNPNLKSH